jgi:hypothetical protein
MKQMKEAMGSEKRTTEHIPLRTCIGCHQVKPKRELVRLVSTADGEVIVDSSGKRSGRGAYLCYNSSCWEAGLKKGRLERALRVKVNPENHSQLIELAKKFSSAFSEN